MNKQDRMLESAKELVTLIYGNNLKVDLNEFDSNKIIVQGHLCSYEIEIRKLTKSWRPFVYTLNNPGRPKYSLLNICLYVNKKAPKYTTIFLSNNLRKVLGKKVIYYNEYFIRRLLGVIDALLNDDTVKGRIPLSKQLRKIGVHIV